MKEETIKIVEEEELREMFRKVIPFKIEVTPELSEKIQEIGFEEGVCWWNEKRFVEYTDAPVLVFDGDKEFTYCSEIDDYFENLSEQEISFKETEEKPFFSSQQEIWKYLLEEEGRRVYGNNEPGTTVGFNNGTLWDWKENKRSYACFIVPEVWKPYIEKQWYENIPKHGILCWVADSEEQLIAKERLKVVISYSVYCSYPFTTKQGTTFKYATPLTKEEVENLIWKREEREE